MEMVSGPEKQKLPEYLTRLGRSYYHYGLMPPAIQAFQDATVKFKECKCYKSDACASNLYHLG
jgi:hypothetical protein